MKRHCKRYVYNLEIPDKEFKVGNVIFKRKNNYDVQISKSHKEQGKVYFLTTCAKYQDNLRNAQLWDKGSELDDYFLLFSLVEKRPIFGTTKQVSYMGRRKEFEEFVSAKAPQIPFEPNPILLPFELKHFFDASLKKLSIEGWAKETAFFPAIHWYFEGLREGLPVELNFISLFIVLELVTNSYCRGKLVPIYFQSKDKKEPGIKDKIVYFFKENGLNLVNKKQVKNCVNIRNDIMHEGGKGAKYTYTIHQIFDCKLLLENLLIIVFFYLLGISDFKLKINLVKFVENKGAF